MERAESIESAGEPAALRVAVLCGGFGTRLGELAQGLPKPMIPIGGRPYLDAGFSVMLTSTIDILPPAGACSFEEIVYANLAEHGQLEGEVVDHDFYDIGTPEELAKTRAALEVPT